MTNKTKKNKTKKNNTKTKKNNTKTKKNKESEHIRILSYNISWESMTGRNKNWILCSNNDNETNPKHFSVCVNNISGVIEETHSDFVCLQEAMDYEKLIKESPRLASMKHEHHKSGLDNMVTFWKSKYRLLHCIKGEFEEGRPWMATIFNKGICLINVHFGHYKHDEEFEKMEKMFGEVREGIKQYYRKQNNNKTVIKKIRRYIIAGDFNYDIKKYGDDESKFELEGIRFYFYPRKIITCRINRLRHYDHVIDTKGTPLYLGIPEVDYMASDHKPIFAKLV